MMLYPFVLINMQITTFIKTAKKLGKNGEKLLNIIRKMCALQEKLNILTNC